MRKVEKDILAELSSATDNLIHISQHAKSQSRVHKFIQRKYLITLLITFLAGIYIGTIIERLT